MSQYFGRNGRSTKLLPVSEIVETTVAGVVLARADLHKMPWLRTSQTCCLLEWEDHRRCDECIQPIGRKFGRSSWFRSRRVVFLASDDDDAAAQVGSRAEILGFSSIQLGSLSGGGLLMQSQEKRWGQLIFKNLVKFD